ncbi:MAG: hypothetical protein KAJ51_12525 [Thermoplasmata archaeon]|nr:hypothetical protein [Thermoplasmata archaeon]
MCFVCAIIISGCIGPSYGKYEIDFSRNYSNANERIAIGMAENINYSFYVNMSRFEDEWANFIDSETINHYNNSFYSAKNNKEEIDISYTYFATTKFYQELNISAKSEGRYLNVSINGIDHTEIFHKGNEMFFDSEKLIIVLVNETETNIIKAQEEYPFKNNFYFDKSYGQIYLIEMYLSYGATWDLVGAYYVETFQILILDENYNLEMIILSPSDHIVS